MPKKTAKESNINNKLVFFVSAVFVLFVIYIVFINLQLFSIQKSLSKKSEIDVLGENMIESEEKYWNDFLESNPGYLPGYIELYNIEYENKNFSRAGDLKEVIFELNPNLNL